MSLLIGANLSDRIYMCADTCLSRIDEKGNISLVHNNQLKIIHLGDGTKAVGCVGSPQMGTFILKGLDKKGLLSLGIKEFQEKLVGEIGPVINDYLVSPRLNGERPRIDTANVAFVFMGLDTNDRKKISRAKLFDAVSAHQEAQKEYLDKLFEGKKVTEFSDEEMGRFRFEVQQQKMGLKRIVFESLKGGHNQGVMELPMFNQHMFLLEIRCSKPDDEKIRFRNVEYGEIVVRGSRYEEGDIPKRFFGDLEFRSQSGNPDHDLIPFISEIKDRYSETIGGSITNMAIIGNEVVSFTGWKARSDPNDYTKFEMLYHTKHEDGEQYHMVEEKWKRLIPFNETPNCVTEMVM